VEKEDCDLRPLPKKDWCSGTHRRGEGGGGSKKNLNQGVTSPKGKERAGTFLLSKKKEREKEEREKEIRKKKGDHPLGDGGRDKVKGQRVSGERLLQKEGGESRDNLSGEGDRKRDRP